MCSKITLVIINILILSTCSPLSLPKPAPALTATASPLSESQPTSIATQGETPPMTPIPSTPSASGLPNLIEQAKADLAQRLSIPATQITVVDARDVVWSNSSLGCPQPGMLYAEVLTPGYLILLNANGQDYEYHAGKNSETFYCEDPTLPVPGMSGDT